MDFVREKPGEPVPEEYSPTHTYVVVINRPLSASSIYCDPWHPPCSIQPPDNLFPQSLSKFSLVYLLAWHPPVHTPYISSPNHCLLYATHAPTIATCFAVVPRLCHLILVSLLTLYLEFCFCSFMPHIHLTILISSRWSATLSCKNLFQFQETWPSLKWICWYYCIYTRCSASSWCCIVLCVAWSVAVFGSRPTGIGWTQHMSYTINTLLVYAVVDQVDWLNDWWIDWV